MGRIGDKKTIRPLILQLDDNSPDVQTKVIEAIGELGKGEPLVISPLIKKLQSKNLNMLWQTINSLGILEDEKPLSR